jgi:hypothetical protein
MKLIFDFGVVRDKLSFMDDSPSPGKEVEIRADWLAEFEAAAQWTVEERIKNGFIKKYRPVLDDGPSRSFDSMSEYREWCERNLPAHLGFHR